jgi:hypothetical protein
VAARQVDGKEVMRRMRLWITLSLAIVSFGASAAQADTIVNRFTALPGNAASCQWFDDNINDRSIDALVRQTDLLYNRAPLPAGQNVTIADSATTQRGVREVSFTLGRRLLCTSDEAFTESTPAPSPTPVMP